MPMYDELVNSFNLNINTIKIGEYVRTDSGYISVVLDVEKGGIKIKSNYREWIGLCCIKSHSQNLIDLVEVGDIVNGREVKHIAMFEGFPDYPELIFVDKTHLVPGDSCENTEIETILTHEQYERNCFKAGDKK